MTRRRRGLGHGRGHRQPARHRLRLVRRQPARRPVRRRADHRPAGREPPVPDRRPGRRRSRCPPDWDATAFHKLDRLNQLVLWCCSAALRDAGLWDRRADLRVGIMLGLGAEVLRNWELDSYAAAATRDPAEDSPEVVRTVRGQLGLTGPAIGGGRRLCQRQRRPDPGPPMGAAGLGGRRPGRRVRPVGDADGPGRLRQPAGAVEAERPTRPRPAGRSTAIATASSWAKAGRCSCWSRPPRPAAARPESYAELAGVRLDRRRLAPGHPQPGPGPGGAGGAGGPGRRRRASRRGRLRQRPRHRHVVGDRAEAAVIRDGVRPGHGDGPGQLDQEHDRPPAERRRGRGGAGVPGGPGSPGRAADDQPRQSRPGVRPVSRPAHGPRAAGAGGRVQFVRLRRQQQLRGAAGKRRDSDVMAVTRTTPSPWPLANDGRPRRKARYKPATGT